MKLNHIKYTELGMNLKDYVKSLDSTSLRDFINEVDCVIDFTKSKYKKTLIVHFVTFLLFCLSLKVFLMFMTPLCLMFLTSQLTFLSVATFYSLKKWKLVRHYKFLKKNIQVLWLGEAKSENDDLEFLTKGTRFKD